jgi:hypothetical protein
MWLGFRREPEPELRVETSLSGQGCVTHADSVSASQDLIIMPRKNLSGRNRTFSSRYPSSKNENMQGIMKIRVNRYAVQNLNSSKGVTFKVGSGPGLSTCKEGVRSMIAQKFSSSPTSTMYNYKNW